MSGTLGPVTSALGGPELRPDGSAVVTVMGEVDLANAPELDALLHEAMTSGEGSVLLDLSECTFLDSSALHVMVQASQDLADAGRRLIVVGANGSIRRIVDITGLHSFLGLERRDQTDWVD